VCTEALSVALTTTQETLMGRETFGLTGESMRSRRDCDDILARQLTDITSLPAVNYKETNKVLHTAAI
jgi:hypothetical protein